MGMEIHVVRHCHTTEIYQSFEVKADSEFVYGRSLVQHEESQLKGFAYYKGLKRAFQIESNDLEMYLGKLNFSHFLSPDVSDPLVQLVLKAKHNLKVVYLQHSNIIKEMKAPRIKANLINFLFLFWSGIRLTLDTSKPPFYFRQIHYLLWSNRWSNNLKGAQYRIHFLSRILGRENIKVQLPKDKMNKILVILNKRGFLNESEWNKFALFYQKAFAYSDLDLVFKVHPRDSLEFTQSKLAGFDVRKGSVATSEFGIVVGHWSSYLFDALLMGKPYILVNPNNEFNMSLFRLEDYPLMVSEPSLLRKQIRDLQFETQTLQALEDIKKTYFGNGFDHNVSRLIQILSAI